MNITESYGLPFISMIGLDPIIVGDATLEDFQVEIGNMDYGMEIDGILGFNFLKQAGVVIDARAMELKTVGC